MYMTGGMTRLSVRHDSFMWRTGISIYIWTHYLFICIRAYTLYFGVQALHELCQGTCVEERDVDKQHLSMLQGLPPADVLTMVCECVVVCVCVSVRVRVNMCMCARESVSACVVCMCVTCACYRAFPLLMSRQRCVGVWLHVCVSVLCMSVYACVLTS